MPPTMTRLRRAEPHVSAVAQASYSRRYSFPDSSTIRLAAFGQVVQVDQDVDLAGTVGKSPMPSRKRAS
jgi:hypothetical protein